MGGTAAGSANTISFNGRNDVQIFDASANVNKIQGNIIHRSAAAGNVGINVLTFSQNSIFGHRDLGIDLAPAGVNRTPRAGPKIGRHLVGSSLQRDD